MDWLGDIFDGFTYDHPAAILVYITFAFAMGLAVNKWGQWRSYHDGYRQGRRDGRADRGSHLDHR
jgi:hypothetical protein